MSEHPKSSVRGSLTRLAIAATVLAVVSTLSACGGGGSEKSDGPTTHLKVAVGPTPASATIFAAQKLGYFKDAGLDVSIDAKFNFSQLVPALAGGSVNVMDSNLATMVNTEAGGVNITELAGGTKGSGGFIQVLTPTDSPLRSVADLEGKKFGTWGIGSICDMSVKNELRHLGKDPSKVTFVQITPSTMGQSLDQGQVAAACFPEPFLSQVKDRYDFRVLADLFSKDHDLYETPMDAYFTTCEFAKENKANLDKFSAALVKAGEYIQQHPDFVAEVSTFTGAPQAVLEKMGLAIYDSKIDLAGNQKVADIMFAQGMLKQKFDVQSLVSESC